MKTLLLSIFIISIASYKVVGQTRKDSLLVFVGEKIEVREIPQERVIEHIDTIIKEGDTTYRESVSLSMDGKFLAKYKVLQQVYGLFSSDTIEFVAYDHYGTPAFSKYKTVLLYVSNYNDVLIHEKYQFADVYKTNNGRWASGYRVGDYEHDFNKNTTIKPEPIKFEKEVSYNLKGRTKKDIAEWFPSPYYKIKGNKAIAVYGNYVEELFGLKQSGVLKARGVFD
jgi:hypothetical protein